MKNLTTSRQVPIESPRVRDIKIIVATRDLTLVEFYAEVITWFLANRPTDPKEYLSPQGPSIRKMAVHFSLPDMDSVIDASAHLGVTQQSFIYTAFVAFLSHYHAQENSLKGASCAR